MSWFLLWLIATLEGGGLVPYEPPPVMVSDPMTRRHRP
jgi:hypothetical protein